MRKSGIIATAVALVGLCEAGVGDICNIQGQKMTVLDNKLYFIGGNISWVTTSGYETNHSQNLYWIELNSAFPVEGSIPYGLLKMAHIDSDITGAVQNALGDPESPFNQGTPSGALFVSAPNGSDPKMFPYAGLTSNTGSSELSMYDVSSGKWSNEAVEGGELNYGSRFDALWTSVPDAGLSFILGVRSPFMGGMVRLDASDPARLSWTNETLGAGSSGVAVPDLGAGSMIYIPAGEEGILIAFGGFNVSTGISPYSGWPGDSDMSKIGVYDIASHTWWLQKADGDVPTGRGSFCSVVSAAPDGSAFHITMYGGWSLQEGRSFEDTFVLSLPSFTWINVTSSNNIQQQVEKRSGRDGAQCVATAGATQMVVLGGIVREGSDQLDPCQSAYPPSRVLDLNTYTWQRSLSTETTYKVPRPIYEMLGGNSTGGATRTVPQSGFADNTLSSILQLRVATPDPVAPSENSGTTTTLTPETTDTNSSSGSGASAGTIAGAAIGGAAGLAVIGLGIWFLLRKRRQGTNDPAETTQMAQANDIDPKAGNYYAPVYSSPQELHDQPRPYEAGSVVRYELPEATQPVELDTRRTSRY